MPAIPVCIAALAAGLAAAEPAAGVETVVSPPPFEEGPAEAPPSAAGPAADTAPAGVQEAAQAAPVARGTAAAASPPASPEAPAAPAAAAAAKPAAPAVVHPLVADAAAGAVRAATCAGCHGPDGNSPNPLWPKLAGQRFEYIVKQLRDFKAGRRIDPMMSAMAAPLSEQDIVDVATHFVSQRVQIGAAPPGQVALGENLYMTGRPEARVIACVSCHGPNGEGFARAGIVGGIPAVGGQHAAYVTKQLQSFRAGARANDWLGIMQLISENLTDEEIAALAAYMQTLDRDRPALPGPGPTALGTTVRAADAQPTPDAGAQEADAPGASDG